MTLNFLNSILLHLKNTQLNHLKKWTAILLVLFATHIEAQDDQRLQGIRNNLEVLALDNPELNENLKLEINVSNVTLSNFLIAVSKVHDLNLTVSPDVGNETIVNNFSNVTVTDLLLFLCKEYQLDIDFTGNIFSIRKYNAPPPETIEKEIKVIHDSANELISMDVNNDPLEKVFRKIMDVSGKNLLYANGMENQPITLYLSDVPFDVAMEKLAEVNNLEYTKSRDGFYLFNSNESDNNTTRKRIGSKNVNYSVIDTLNKTLSVDFQNTPIASIIDNLSYDLNLNIYSASPLEQAGSITFNAERITFDDMLQLIFESQENSSANAIFPQRQENNNIRPNQRAPSPQETSVNFTFKKENNIYFFGTANQLSVRNVEVIQMMHRSVELLTDSSRNSSGIRSAGRTNNSSINYYGNSNSNGIQGQQNYGNQGQQNYGSQRNINTNTQSFQNHQDDAEALVNILPDEIKKDLDIKVDTELNSFLVSGPSSKIDRFKKFIKKIDKPVPVILIEVMLIEVKKSSTVETGISWGIGENEVNTKGNLFPETNLNLGSKTVNKIIGGFDGFGSFNIGQVVPEFFANIKAMEENGNLKIRSTPKLSTLNGHRAHLSIGETTYYVVTNQNFFGSQIPTSSEIRNYEPIDAELAVSIRPLVSGNGQITLDINVIQSDFSGERIEDDAPPGLTSREFSSIIRMQNQDLAILGGLEEKIKNDSGNGVPLLARIPIIKWLFSTKKREDTKQKLTILIKPTVIY
ncbi:type II secretion system protein GspD [Zobellia laminariae]|uniref:secretin N-terminal domain-containing protein n=1 Tax=Zobellia laminariae TaxID=248906 RepID=UPI0012D8A6A8|nr:general secretion pathway protein GspD [Zobellia laminariae]